jgi:hypothetical protein
LGATIANCIRSAGALKKTTQIRHVRHFRNLLDTEYMEKPGAIHLRQSLGNAFLPGKQCSYCTHDLWIVSKG